MRTSFVEVGLGAIAGLATGLALFWRHERAGIAQPIASGSREGTYTNVSAVGTHLYGVAPRSLFPSQTIPIHSPPTATEIRVMQEQLRNLGLWRSRTLPSGLLDAATREAYRLMVSTHYLDWSVYEPNSNPTVSIAPGREEFAALFTDYVYNGGASGSVTEQA